MFITALDFWLTTSLKLNITEDVFPPSFTNLPRAVVLLLTLYSGCYYVMSFYFAQKMKFSIKDFFSKCDQIRSFLRIWSHLLKKSLMENFIFLCSFYNLMSVFNLKSRYCKTFRKTVENPVKDCNFLFLSGFSV